MALFGDDQGRTEKPTPGRLDEARNRGDTHLSRELVSAGTLMVAALSMRSLGGWLFDRFAAALRAGLDVDLRAHPLGAGDVPGACREIARALALVGAPLLTLLALVLLASLAFGYGQIGWRLSAEALAPKLDRLHPAANWRRLFAPQSFVRAAFAAAKLAVLAAVLWLVLRDRWRQLALLPEQEHGAAMRVVADLALTLLLWVAGAAFVLAAADVFWQRFDFERRNMMTRQEVEDERRRSEGDPVVKSRLRQARMEMLRHRMMEAVPKADVVITNPEHFAVALRYDRKRNAAPEVVAKGVEELALRIRGLAREHGVAVMEDPPLARALYRAVKVGQEIPVRFYAAVAAVLSHVYRLGHRVA